MGFNSGFKGLILLRAFFYSQQINNNIIYKRQIKRQPEKWHGYI